ncbi:uncharacterized protein ASPGLDRAFT_33615 [Aspergillus glaucus CBS 516.65]|uniref:Uncharacterized protein n=1 Tax=Aspergillus glaucus CBS 516.65 TaxID=1160497 RepID=A0A1L9VS35_ASPGL|nr:hypothetical protein ASPGLDRAFT_33615 [Aspergillus glaucus CBS 516.65]OJJ86728.1 hypothetical protein ASPGLDRAFT_33615 [Aspergillus glaucus CBS 516.65]
MGLLELPRELLRLIGDHLGQAHLNYLCRVNNFLYSALNGYLYRYNSWYGNSSAISAIEGNHVDVARMLLDWGADIYFKDAGGMTPYMYAKQTLNIALIELLLEPRDTGLDGADIEY